MILERLPSRIVQVIPFDGLSTESQYLCENVDKKKTKRSRQLLAIASVARADRQKPKNRE